MTFLNPKTLFNGTELLNTMSVKTLNIFSNFWSIHIHMKAGTNGYLLLLKNFLTDLVSFSISTLIIYTFFLVLTKNFCDIAIFVVRDFVIAVR